MPQRRFYLPQLQAMAAHLHLLVQPSQKLELPIGLIARQVASAIEAGPGGAGKWIGKEAFRSQLRALVVAARQALATNEQFPGHTHGHRLRLRLSTYNCVLAIGLPSATILWPAVSTCFSADQMVVSVGPYRGSTVKPCSNSWAASSPGSASPPHKSFSCLRPATGLPATVARWPGWPA